MPFCYSEVVSSEPCIDERRGVPSQRLLQPILPASAGVGRWAEGGHGGNRYKRLCTGCTRA
eukprot:scaffold443_cov527-Prasinococcus_capsulatus_cf.AAC.8